MNVQFQLIKDEKHIHVHNFSCMSCWMLASLLVYACVCVCERGQYVLKNTLQECIPRGCYLKWGRFMQAVPVSLALTIEVGMSSPRLLKYHTYGTYTTCKWNQIVYALTHADHMQTHVHTCAHMPCSCGST